ncbi:MAG: HAMP domain-containing histidine kinase [Reichenbachiella sp.]
MIEVAEENKEERTLSDQILWAEWLDTESFLIITEVPTLDRLKAGMSYPINELIREQDLARVTNYFQQLDFGSSVIQFGLKIGNTNTIGINCVTLKDGNHVKCLWKIGDIQKNDSLQLMAMAAHDLRSPINSIIGLTNVLQLMLKNDSIDTKEFGGMVSMIKTSCNNALDFSEDLLELSEIESSNYELKKESVNVNHFMKSFVDTHRLVTLKKGIKVDLITTLDDDTSFLINESKLTRVLGNLLSNATKFSQPNGTIQFKLKNVNSSIIIQVIDEGVGMPPEIVDNLFVKFGKSKRLGLEGEKSHGLGMSIVKQIINLHSGRITVDSKEGLGTTISLIFRNNL